MDIEVLRSEAQKAYQAFMDAPIDGNLKELTEEWQRQNRNLIREELKSPLTLDRLESIYYEDRDLFEGEERVALMERVHQPWLAELNSPSLMLERAYEIAEKADIESEPYLLANRKIIALE